MVLQQIADLVDTGIWPARTAADGHQDLASVVPPAVVRRETDGDESMLYLHAPPLRTLGQELARGAAQFWRKFGALEQIDPHALLLLGDFGLGSDAPIVLELEPPNRVLRLRWSGRQTNWVVWADSLAELLERLGLTR